MTVERLRPKEHRFAAIAPPEEDWVVIRDAAANEHGAEIALAGAQGRHENWIHLGTPVREWWRPIDADLSVSIPGGPLTQQLCIVPSPSHH